VVVVKKPSERYLVIENGYHSDRFEIPVGKLKKLMKVLLKKEFPRSNKVRMYIMGEFEESEVFKTKRKTL